MAIVTQTLNVDLRPHYNRLNKSMVYCSQYDNDLRNIVLNIANEGVPVDVSTYTIYIEGTKPDKHGFSYELTSIGGSVLNNVVTVPLQTQMTAVAGLTNAEVVLYSNDERIGSANFILNVEKAGLAEDVDISETDIPAYIDGAQQAAQAAEDAKDAAVDAKDTAVAVAASIPADYTTLSNDVDDLKSAFSSLDLEINGNTELSLTDVTNEKYVQSNGVIANNTSMCYGFVDIGGYEQVIVDTSAFADTVIINACDSNKAFVQNVKNWVGPNKYTVTVGDNIKYLCISAKIADVDKLSVYVDYSGQSIVSSLAETKEVIVQDQTSFIECESGGYLDASGAKYDTKQRIRNKLPISVKGYSSITIPTGYSAWFYRYDKNGDFISHANSWKSGKVDLLGVLTADTKYINILIKNDATPESDISSEISTVENGLILSLSTLSERNIKNSFVETQINNARHATNPLTLLHFSDLHADRDALNRIMSDADYFGTLVDDAICTGDLVADTNAQISSWWNPNVMTCIGNHDSASYSGGAYNWTALSMANRDAYYIAPFESNWGITHTSGTSYYYKDYATQNVRLIVMDAMLYSSYESDTSLGTAQTAWLANLLADAITNNLHVLIAIHAPHGGATAADCSFSRYGQGTMPTYNDCNTPQTVIDTVATAIGNGLKFIGYIVGHTHQDNVWDAEGDGKQLMYCVTCAAVAQEAQWKNSDQHRSASEDAYNLVTIDTTHTLIKIVRGGGADIDDHMRTRKAICFNYSTGQKVGEVL